MIQLEGHSFQAYFWLFVSQISLETVIFQSNHALKPVTQTNKKMVGRKNKTEI